MYTSKEALEGAPMVSAGKGLAAVPAPGAGSLAAPLLVEYWQVVKRWKWVIIGIIVAALVAGAIVTMLMTPLYTASSRVEIAREEANVSPVEGVETAASRQDYEFYDTQYNLLRARSLAERVARDLRLSRDAEFRSAVGLELVPEGGLLASNRDKAVISQLLANINITPITNSSLVDVQFTSADPKVSAKISNAWAHGFIDASLARRFEATADARKFLEQRLAELRVKLENSERQFINNSANSGIVTLEATQVDGKTTSRRTLAAADLETLNQALAAATADRIQAQALAANAVSGDARTTAAALTGPTRQRRAELAADYERMMVQFTPSYPPARALKEQIDALDQSIAREEGRVRSGTTIDLNAAYRAALTREQALRGQVESLRSQYGAEQRAGIDNNILQREVDTNRQLYDALLQRYKEIGVARVGANNISIVDLAEIPTSPSRPNLALNLLFALIAGMAIAAVVTLALNQIDEGLRVPAEVAPTLGIPLLGSVPAQDPAEIIAQIGDPKAESSEAYLSILSNLAFSTDHGLPRSILLTSTRPAEGKSTSSLALAAMIGRSDRTVVLLDADLRKASLHKSLEVENRGGLSNFLAGEDDWRQYLQPTKYRGVMLLPSGPKPPSAGELLSGDRLRLLIEQLSDQFQHVVVDAPPILGLADAPLLSRVVEGSIFVVEARGVAVRGVRNSLERLRAVNAHILGAILTKLPQSDAAYGYGYGYGYGYSYGEPSDEMARTALDKP
jgi:succinoglycan biosynthesis transport protein ExoP